MGDPGGWGRGAPPPPIRPEACLRLKFLHRQDRISLFIFDRGQCISSILIGSLNLGYQLTYLSLTLYGKRLCPVCQAKNFCKETKFLSEKLAEKVDFASYRRNTENAGKCHIASVKIIFLNNDKLPACFFFLKIIETFRF